MIMNCITILITCRYSKFSKRKKP